MKNGLRLTSPKRFLKRQEIFLSLSGFIVSVVIDRVLTLCQRVVNPLSMSPSAMDCTLSMSVL